MNVTLAIIRAVQRRARPPGTGRYGGSGVEGSGNLFNAYLIFYGPWDHWYLPWPPPFSTVLATIIEGTFGLGLLANFSLFYFIQWKIQWGPLLFSKPQENKIQTLTMRVNAG